MTVTTNSRKKTSAKSTSVKEPTSKKEAVVETPSPVKRKYEKDDMIPVKSLFEGEVILVGRRTKQDYHMTELGEVIEVEYQDINAEIISGQSPYIYTPLILVMDEELVSTKPKLKALYESLVSIEDIHRVIEDGNIDELREMVKHMPKGQIDLTKNIVASKIAEGQLGNMRIVKNIDRLLGTEFATQLEMIA